VHDSSARATFGVEPTPYRVAVERALERAATGEVETDWAGSFPARQPDGDVSLEAREGLVFERRSRLVHAPVERVFATFCGLGGKRGWYWGNGLWQARAWLDRAVGGVGMRRGRRHPDELRAGDALDFWRVESVVPARSLRLRAEMKVPGRAWLLFEAEPLPDGTRLKQTAVFEPRGLAGLLYWYLLYPLHQLVFSGMIAAIGRRAEGEAA